MDSVARNRCLLGVTYPERLRAEIVLLAPHYDERGHEGLVLSLVGVSIYQAMPPHGSW